MQPPKDEDKKKEIPKKDEGNEEEKEETPKNQQTKPPNNEPTQPPKNEKVTDEQVTKATEKMTRAELQLQRQMARNPGDQKAILDCTDCLNKAIAELKELAKRHSEQNASALPSGTVKHSIRRRWRRSASSPAPLQQEEELYNSTSTPDELTTPVTRDQVSTGYEAVLRAAYRLEKQLAEHPEEAAVVVECAKTLKDAINALRELQKCYISEDQHSGASTEKTSGRWRRAPSLDNLEELENLADEIAKEASSSEGIKNPASVLERLRSTTGEILQKALQIQSSDKPLNLIHQQSYLYEPDSLSMKEFLVQVNKVDQSHNFLHLFCRRTDRK